jgi:succinoglycan biosynthesis protein ExoL
MADQARKLVVFGFDLAENSQIRRIRAMRALGHEVHSFTMRRSDMNEGFTPEWPNTHLFRTEHENLPKRAAVVAASIVKMLPHRQKLRQADVIFARNLDMLAIAWAARKLAGASHVPLVYECLDINGTLAREDGKGKAMRAAEKALLNRLQMLVVSSPGFIRNYFDPMQDYTGPWALWENKLAAGGPLPQRPTTRNAVASDGPIRLGWVGTIRCAPSLKLLTDLAQRMGADVQVDIHGVVHRHALPDFDQVMQANPNMTWHGPYDYPGDLARVYQSCNMVWAQDLWQRGNNSDWLLPNRIYEASWGGCPSIALGDTETGQRVASDGLGWTIDSPDAAALEALLRQLSPADIQARGQALLDRDDGDFVQTGREIQQVIDQLTGAQTLEDAA